MKGFVFKRTLFIHLMTALVLLLKGWDKITNDHLVSGIILLVLGILFLILIFFEEKLFLDHNTVKPIFYVIEFIALMIIAVVFYLDDTSYLHYVFGGVAVVYLILAVIAFNKRKILHK